jgi:hypothetical protein
MNLILEIRVLHGLGIQQFVVPVNLSGPATLSIKPADSGRGYMISILDDQGESRVWYCVELYRLRFQES